MEPQFPVIPGLDIVEIAEAVGNCATVLYNEDNYAKLPEDLQTVLRECMDQIREKNNEITRDEDAYYIEKMKAEVEGILLWAFEGLQRLAANNFKFTESDRTRENREAVKRDNNNVYDFLDSDGYVRLKADLSASSKELYEAYQIYCTENNLPALKPRSFSEALIACQSRYNLEYCNNVTNAAGRRVRGFLGIEVLVRNHMSVFSGDSMRTYVPEDVPEEWRR